MKSRLIAAALITAIASTCTAGEFTLQCPPADPLDVFEVTQCGMAAFYFADVELNLTYREALRTITEPKRAALKAEQRAWVAARDKQCKVAGQLPIDPDSVTPVQLANTMNCLGRVTTQRVAYLADYSPR